MVLCKVTWRNEDYEPQKEYVLCRSTDYLSTLPLLDKYYGLNYIIDLYMLPLEDVPIQLTEETFNKLIHEEGEI